MTRNVCRKEAGGPLRNLREKRKHSSVRVSPAPSGSGVTFEGAQETAPSGPPTHVQPRQSLSRNSIPHELDEDGSTQKKITSSTPLHGLEKARTKQLDSSEKHDEDVVDGSARFTLNELIEEERLKLNDLGYMSDGDSGMGNSTSNCLLVADPGSTTEDGTALASSDGGQDSSLTIDTSLEQNAALIWPKCDRPCTICQTTHVAIPGSTGSETCIRISISIRNVPTSTADQSRHQCSLVPTDKYELSVLGWLIWSTFAHQVATRNSTSGVLPKERHRRDYIYTEITRASKYVPTTVLRNKHDSKLTF